MACRSDGKGSGFSRFPAARRARALAVGLTLAASSCSSGEDARSVLLVTFDTTRADRLGCYGHPNAATPVVDALAERGVRFERAYAPVPITLPSHASLLTGSYPPTHGVRDNGLFVLGGEAETLAEAFRRAGHRTAAFVSAFPLFDEFGLDQGFEVYDDAVDAGAPASPGHMQERSATGTVDAARTWLESLASDESFFLWLHLFDPHEPHHAPERFLRAAGGDPYQAEIAWADAEVGRLLDRIAALGRTDSTVVAVTADHGEAFGEHGEETHAILLYDGTLRIPLVLAGPGVEPAAGRAVPGEPVSLVDLAPTLAELAGLGADAARSFSSFGAASLVPAWRSGEPMPPRDLYFESCYPRWHHGWSELFGIARGEWKYVEAPGALDGEGRVRAELFAPGADPREERDLTGERAEVARDLAARLGALRTELAALGSGGSGGSRREVEEGDLEQLDALGYGGADLSAGASSAGSAPGRDPREVVEAVMLLNGVRAFSMAGSFERAESFLNRLRSIDPDGVGTHEATGEFELARGRANEAVDREALARAAAAFGRAAELSPGRRGPWFKRGVALRLLERFEEALAAFDRAIEVAPPTPALLEARASVAARLGLPESP